MKNIFQPGLLRKIRFVSFAVITVLIVFTPYLTKKRFSFLEEETLEMFIIAFLFSVEFIIDLFFEREIKRREKKLAKAWEHVGKVNLTVEKFQEAFFDLQKYPENKKDFQQLLLTMSEKVLGIVNCSTVMFRILEIENGRTLAEYTQIRYSSEEEIKIQVGNKDLLEGSQKKGYKIIASSAKNAKIKTFCVLRASSLNESQRIFIKKIVNDLAMFYLIFSSQYYKK